VVAEAFDPQARRKTVSVGEVPPEWRIMDIGPNTVRRFTEKLDTAKTVVWNGPLGVTEMSDFAEGTNQIARVLARLDAVTVVGGGDSVAAVNQAGVADRITHVSTGGGAFLNFMEDKTLPGVAVLKDT
jgi:phosphoglycerate kinase